MQEGDSIFPGWTVASLPDLRSLRVRARLFDVDDGRVEAGQEATVVLDAYPGRALPARIQRVDEIAHQGGRRSTVRAFAVLVDLAIGSHPDDGDLILLPGMSVRVVVDAVGKSAAGLRVPREALRFSSGTDGRQEDGAGQGMRVWVVDEGGNETEVILGACSAWFCDLVEGPPAGTILRSAEPSS